MRTRFVLSAALLLLCLACGAAFGQQETPGPRLFFGPRIGVSAVVMDPSAFNTSMQVTFPNSAKQYFPVFTEMGMQALQLVPLGESRSSLSFQEMILVSGLDQSIPVVSVNAIIGYRMGAGLEIGLGPYVSSVTPSGSFGLSASVVYELGWTIAAKGFSVPVTVMFIPLPSYVNPKVSLLLGFLFEMMD